MCQYTYPHMSTPTCTYMCINCTCISLFMNNSCNEQCSSIICIMYCIHSTSAGYSIASQPWPLWVASTDVVAYGMCCVSQKSMFLLRDPQHRHATLGIIMQKCTCIHFYVHSIIGNVWHTLEASLVRCASLVALSSTCSSSLFSGLVNYE